MHIVFAASQSFGGHRLLTKIVTCSHKKIVTALMKQKPTGGCKMVVSVNGDVVKPLELFSDDNNGNDDACRGE